MCLAAISGAWWFLFFLVRKMGKLSLMMSGFHILLGLVIWFLRYFPEYCGTDMDIYQIWHFLPLCVNNVLHILVGFNNVRLKEKLRPKLASVIVHILVGFSMITILAGFLSKKKRLFIFIVFSLILLCCNLFLCVPRWLLFCETQLVLPNVKPVSYYCSILSTLTRAVGRALPFSLQKGEKCSDIHELTLQC